MNLEKDALGIAHFDAVIEVKNSLTEATLEDPTVNGFDPRVVQVGGNNWKDVFLRYIVNNGNPYTAGTAGDKIGTALGYGGGYSYDVVDYGSDCVVVARYTNRATGKTAQAMYLVKFTPQGSIVKSGAMRYRIVSDLNQAATYIKSRANYLSQKTTWD